MSLNQLLKPPSNYSRNIQAVDPYTLAAHHNVVMSFQDRPTQKATAFSTSCCSTDSKRPYHRYHLPNKVKILISHRFFLTFTMGREMPPNCQFTWGTWPPSNIWFLGSTQVHTRNRISISPATLTVLVIMSNIPRNIGNNKINCTVYQ